MTNMKEDARALFMAAVRAVQPDVLLDWVDLNTLTDRPIESYDRVFVLGIGKAAIAMAAAAERRLGRGIDKGCAVVPGGYSDSWLAERELPSTVRVMEGGHPVPDPSSVAAAREVLRIAAEANRGDLVVALISGGGSAVCADYFGGITLDEAAEVFRSMTRAAVTIQEMNMVRKHLSRVGGGRLAAAAYPAETLALIISDAVGDDISVIASGPTAADPTTAGDALEVLSRAGIQGEIPPRVIRFLEEVRKNPDLETLKPGAPVLESVRNEIVATNATALSAADEAARAIGYRVIRLSDPLAGEARESPQILIDAARAAGKKDPVCVLAGGETTVTLRGPGLGGRNQEAALAAAIALEGTEDVAYLSAGTDGIDGATEMAGAVVDGATAAKARGLGIDAARFLDSNDSYSFFRAVGGHVRTGPTHTNAMDVQVLLWRDPLLRSS